MKLIDFLPIMIITAALVINVYMGIKNHVGFSILMIRCIVVTIVFGVFGFLITKTVSNIVEYYRISMDIQNKDKVETTTENKSEKGKINPILDIKVPPLDDKALESIDYDSDDEFVEVNPADMGKYGKQ
ncbi:MAG: hypothetical protein GX301_02985 [Gracilibacteraceae bacterium]|nr:hypothetical protein [Gracilibacteraceae bacterium]